jgi:hypothetical protein
MSLENPLNNRLNTHKSAMGMDVPEDFFFQNKVKIKTQIKQIDARPAPVQRALFWLPHLAAASFALFLSLRSPLLTQNNDIVEDVFVSQLLIDTLVADDTQLDDLIQQIILDDLDQYIANID